jgi:hypothetical protein
MPAVLVRAIEKLLLWDAPVAPLIFLGEAIQVKAIEGDALPPNRDLTEPRAHLGIEPIAVHA